MPNQTARQAAAAALIKINYEGGYSNLVLNEMLKKSELSREDRAFASRLFYGTLERKLTLDRVIANYSKKPVQKLTPAVAEILRISLYQILYLDSVPDRAAVDEAVKLTRKMKVSSASGFVNAVLRNFLRDKKQLPQAKGTKQLEIDYSCPAWIIDELSKNYGKEAAVSMLNHSLDRPPLYARVNRCKITADELIERLKTEGVCAHKDAELEDCILMEGTFSIEELPSFKAGLFHVQDKSSQLCALTLQAQPGEKILDCCAAPGSKSFTIAEQMNGEGTVISCDVFPEKIKKINTSAERLGLSCVQAKLHDGCVFESSFGQFDRVLCDVPCSGLGIIARKPEIKYKDRCEFRELPPLQAKILDTASRYVKTGGTLVYSTCTLLNEENSAVVEKFLQEHPEFEPCPLPQQVQKAIHSEDESVWKVTLLPQMADTDGFFISCVKKVR